jgi:hypothetical protein
LSEEGKDIEKLNWGKIKNSKQPHSNPFTITGTMTFPGIFGNDACIYSAGDLVLS